MYLSKAMVIDTHGHIKTHSMLESWQSTPVPVEWGQLVLDVPGLQQAVSLDVAVGVNHHGLG